MKHINRWLVIVVVLVAVGLSACGPTTTTVDKIVPSQLEPIEGTDLSRVILTEKAAERIGVETVTASGTSVPYAAIIYDTEGNTWIYTNPEPLTFLRVPVVVDYIEGDTAMLAKALDAEMNVVTVGVAELYGTETGVSK